MSPAVTYAMDDARWAAWCAQPGTDVFGFPWSSWIRQPARSAPSSSTTKPTRMDTQRPVKPPTAVGGHRVTVAVVDEHQLELAL